MGHSEMLLAVAGLKDEEIKQRTEKLASGDWSDFKPAERLAFGFAYKLTREPSAVSDEDIKTLAKAFGQERAVDLIWYASWCNFMTRFADSFQLTLEPTNAFVKPKEDKP